MAIRNNLLFSEYFFNQIRSDTRDLENLRANFDTIRQTWGYYKNDLKANDREDIRAKLVQPILGYVGFSYAWHQETGCLLLYSDQSQSDIVGVCLVRALDEKLECTDKGMNFAQQTIRAMRTHQVCWGILTNGSQWRLYRLGGPAPIEAYLEADLATVVAENAMPEYIVFQRFFSGPSFARTGGNRLMLDTYQEQSEKGTAYIEQHLQDKVEEIVKQLCLGFIEQMPGEKWTDEKLKQVYDNAMYLLYRLLFVLYAEARHLLPLEIPRYKNLSLKRLLEDALRNHKDGSSATDDFELWKGLRQLFGLIDIGDTAEGILPYNGGLFRSGRWDLLDKGRIRNAFLNSVLLDLAFMPGADSHDEQTAIDYRDLSVRHLGSLYEGLLESKLFLVDDEPIVVRQDKKKLRYVPLSEAGNVKRSEAVLEVGKAYLAENKHERKATGSYYTPEYVVQHLVDQTVQPKLEELRVLLLELIAADMESLKFAANESEAARIRKLIDEKCLSFIEQKVLALKILDIAMGSGHFLTNAMLAVAEFIVNLLNETPWHNPDITTDIVHWKRRVAENCIFGVDLNLLAVELAKLSLWITTADLNKPLTFLDHHLRHGNSLIGIRLNELGKYPTSLKEKSQTLELDMRHFGITMEEVLGKFRQMRGLESKERDEVKEKEMLYSQVREALGPYRDLADLQTFSYFDDGIDENTFAKLGNAIQYGSGWQAKKRELKIIDALERAQSKHYFHWDVEFPEAFFAENTNGFDIILENPPYVDETPSIFLRQHYSTASGGNLYAFMMERSGIVSASSSRLGMIVPMSLVCSSRMRVLRDWLKANYSTIRVANFGIRPAKIFPNVDQRVTILTAQKKTSPDEATRIWSTRFNRWHEGEELEMIANLKYAEITDLPDELGWAKLGDEIGRGIANKLINRPHRVESYLGPSTKFHVHGIGRYWLKAYDFLPIFQRSGGKSEPSSTLFDMSFQTEELSKLVLAIVNSGLFFWYWILYGDDFHLMREEIKSFPFSHDPAMAKVYAEIKELASDLMADYQKNSIVKQGKYASGEKTWQEFYPRKSKPIIDKIDNMLGVIYGLTEVEIAYIKNYDVAFRTDESNENE